MVPGVSAGGGLQEFVEVVEEHRVAIGEARPSCSRPAESVGRGFGSGTVKFGKSRSDGGPRDPRGLGDGRGSPQPRALAPAADHRRRTRSSIKGARA